MIAFSLIVKKDCQETTVQVVILICILNRSKSQMMCILE